MSIGTSRAAGPEDARGIAELIRSSKAAAMPWLSVPHTAEDDVAWVSGHLLPEHTVTVVVVEGTIVGVLAVRDGWLEQLYVRTDAQGRGVGTDLLSEAKRSSPRGLQLWAFQRNGSARRFYERAGFTEQESTDGSGNQEREPDVRYRWAGVGSQGSPSA